MRRSAVGYSRRSLHAHRYIFSDGRYEISFQPDSRLPGGPTQRRIPIAPEFVPAHSPTAPDLGNTADVGNLGYQSPGDVAATAHPIINLQPVCRLAVSLLTRISEEDSHGLSGTCHRDADSH